MMTEKKGNPGFANDHKPDRGNFDLRKGSVLPTSHVSAPMPKVQAPKAPSGNPQPPQHGNGKQGR